VWIWTITSNEWRCTPASLLPMRSQRHFHFAAHNLVTISHSDLIHFFEVQFACLLKEVAGVCFVIDKWWGLEKGAAAAFPGGGCFSSSFNLPPHDAVYFYAHKSLRTRSAHEFSPRFFSYISFLHPYTLYNWPLALHARNIFNGVF
jgi:hypothetical protein